MTSHSDKAIFNLDKGPNKRRGPPKTKGESTSFFKLPFGGQFTYETGAYVFSGNQRDKARFFGASVATWNVVPIDPDDVVAVALIVPTKFDLNFDNLKGRFGLIPVVVTHDRRTFVIQGLVGPFEFEL